MADEGSSLSRHERQRLEQEWRERVQAAKKAYQIAATDLNRVIRVVKSQDEINADGQQALYRTLKIEGAALKEYVQTLRVFTDLIMHGSVPGHRERGGP